MKRETGGVSHQDTTTPREEGVFREGEFEDDEASAGAEDAGEFVDGLAPVGDVANAEGDGEDVGGFAWQGQGHRVPLEELRNVGKAMWRICAESG